MQGRTGVKNVTAFATAADKSQRFETPRPVSVTGYKEVFGLSVPMDREGGRARVPTDPGIRTTTFASRRTSSVGRAAQAQIPKSL
jgi:hypothetical protein